MSFQSVVLMTLLFLGSSLMLHAQPAEQVDVVKQFNARLAEAERVMVNPELPPLDTIDKRLQYDIRAQPMDVKYLPPRIRPLSLRREEPDPSYSGQLRVGGGAPRAVYVEGSYHLNTSERFTLGLDALHHSFNNTNNVENMITAENEYKLHGTYFAEQGFAVNAHAGYELDFFHFYGYNKVAEDFGRALSYNKNEVKQRFSNVTGGFEIFNAARTEADFDYRAALDMYFLNDFYNSRENAFDIQLEGTKWFNDRHPLRVLLRTDFTGFRDTARQNLNNIFLHPTFTFHQDIWRLKVGVNLANNDDEFFFFPDVEFMVQLGTSVLSLFGGADGTLQKNDFRALTAYNPFINSEVDIRNSRYYRLYGGVAGEFLGVTYRGEVSYKNVNNLALFINDYDFSSDTIPRFDVLYDDANLITFQLSAMVPLFKNFELSGMISQIIYTMDREDKPWHLPSFTVNAGARYRMFNEQLLLHADFYLQNGVPYLTREGDDANLNALLDLSVGAEFYFLENLGAFAHVNNLLSNRRERWNYYPVLGTNFRVGLSARL